MARHHFIRANSDCVQTNISTEWKNAASSVSLIRSLHWNSRGAEAQGSWEKLLQQSSCYCAKLSSKKVKTDIFIIIYIFFASSGDLPFFLSFFLAVISPPYSQCLSASFAACVSQSYHCSLFFLALFKLNGNKVISLLQLKRDERMNCNHPQWSSCFLPCSLQQASWAILICIIKIYKW